MPHIEDRKNEKFDNILDDMNFSDNEGEEETEGEVVIKTKQNFLSLNSDSSDQTLIHLHSVLNMDYKQQQSEIQEEASDDVEENDEEGENENQLLLRV